MNLTLKATKTTLTPAMKKAINEKLGGLEKFLKSENKLHFECEVNKKQKSGDVFRVEITIQPHGYFAENLADDFYEALDGLVPKIKEQLVKSKEKKLAARRKPAK